MGEMMNNVKTINSVVRTLLMLTIMGGLGYGGWFGYNNYVKPSQQAKQALAELEALQADFETQSEDLARTAEDLARTQKAKEKLQTALKLIKLDRRMAHVKVLKKDTDENGQPFLEVRFKEIDENGNEVGIARDFTLSGEKLYVDCWIVSFEDKYVEKADPLRSASLCVFKSIYGEIDGPMGAKSLDVQTADQNLPPGIYDDEFKTQFEEEIWGDFWSVCNDTQKQKELGIRASYGQANYVLGEEGKTYEVQLRASGGASLRPIEVDEQ